MIVAMKFIVVVLTIFGASLAFPSSKNGTITFEQFTRKYSPLKFGVDVSGRVVGGNEATPHSRPYEAYIGFATSDGGGWLCGGALISHYFVLTAGHCVDEAVSAEVWLGAHNVENEEEGRIIVKSEYLKINDGYYTNFHDIGLVKLAKYVTYTSTIGPINLPPSSNTEYSGDTVVISGWGQTDITKGASTVLMEVEVTVLSNDVCSQYADNTFQICTSYDNNKSACYGDSGSALIYGDTAIGVCSEGTEYCTGGPSIYTSVAYFLDWVKQNSDVQ